MKVSQLKDRINVLLQYPVIYPPYLLDLNSFTTAVTTAWLTFISPITGDLVGKYDELYFTGVEYDALSCNTLIKARDYLNAEDAVNAEKYFQKSETYRKQSFMSFQAAFSLYEGMLDAAEILAQGVKECCQAAVSFGLHVVNPTAAELVDYVYLALDYGVDCALVGKEEATKKLVVGLVGNIILNQI